MAEELVLDIKTNLGQATKDTKDYKKSLEQINEEISIQNEEIVRQEKILIKLKAQQDKNSKGGWSAGMSKLNDKIRDTSELLDLEKNTLKGLNNKKKEATQVVKKNTQALKEGNKESKESIANFEFMGVSLKGVKKGFSQVIPTAKAMFGTIKAGIMSTGIGALVLAVVALMQTFKRSEEGQEKFQRIMAAIGAVTGQVADAFADLGGIIIKTFTDPIPALKTFGKGLVRFLKDPTGETRDMFVKATIAAKGFGKQTAEEIDIMVRVTKERQKAHHIERELRVERAKENRRINDIRLKAEDREKFNATERIELLRKAQDIEQDITNKEIEAKEILRDAQVLEMSIGKNSIEQKDELARMQAELINLDTKRLRSQRLLQTQITTALNEEKAARTDMTKLFVDQIDERIEAVNKLAKADHRAFQNYLRSNDKRKQTDKEVADAKTNITKDGFRLAQELAKEGTVLSKAIAIAEVTASGVEGVQNAFTTAQDSPYTLINPAYPFIQAGLAGAFSAVQLAKIISGTPAGGGGGGGGASAETNTPAPQMMSGAFDISGGVAPDPLQAFVLTDEMTNSQNQLANIRRRATI